MEDVKKGQNQLNVELTEEMGQGIYSNLAIISHSTSEFIIDFARVLPGLSKAGVKSRIILTPEHAKRLLIALQDNVVKYESQNGPIKVGHSGIEQQNQMNFGNGNMPMA